MSGMFRAPARARGVLASALLCCSAALGCHTTPEGAGSPPSASIETATAAAETCSDQCGEVCLKRDATCGTGCSFWERIDNGEQSEMFCRTTTCGAYASVPCSPPTEKPPETPGPGGTGPAGFCGPHLCQVDPSRPARLVGQSQGWGYERISDSPVRFRKYRAVFNHYARPMVVKGDCEISCCDYVYKREACEGTVSPWGGTRACFPPEGGDRARCER